MTPTQPQPYKTFYCDCYEPSHNMIVDAAEEYGVIVYVALNKNRSFWGRLTACFKYMLGIGPGNGYWHYESVHLDKTRVKELVDILNQWQIDYGDVVDTYSEEEVNGIEIKSPYD